MLQILRPRTRAGAILAPVGSLGLVHWHGVISSCLISSAQSKDQACCANHSGGIGLAMRRRKGFLVLQVEESKN